MYKLARGAWTHTDVKLQHRDRVKAPTCRVPVVMGPFTLSLKLIRDVGASQLRCNFIHAARPAGLTGIRLCHG
jgi:hypothetical protein